MKKPIAIFLLVLLIAALIVFTLVWFFEIRPAATVLLKTNINPQLAIRGNRLALDYEISQLDFSLLKDGYSDDIKTGWSQNDLYITLSHDADGYWSARTIYRKPPRFHEKFFLWGRCNSKFNKKFYVRYNIESITLDKTKAAGLQKQLKAVQQEKTELVIGIEAQINWQGKARIKKIIVNGTPYVL